MFTQKNTVIESARSWLDSAYYRLESVYLNSTAFLSQELLGDLPAFMYEGVLANKQNEQGVVLTRVGPRYLGINIAIINLNKNDIAENQLKTFMNLTEPCARDPYKAFNVLTGCEFLLADNSSVALGAHKDFARYLKPAVIIAECKARISEFLTIYTQVAQPLMHAHAAENFILSIYFKAILGLESTPEVIEIYSKVEESLKLFHLIVPLMVPGFLQKLVYSFDGTTMQLHQAIDKACKDFIKLRANAIADLFENNIDNMFTKNLKLIFPDKEDWSQLNADELEYIGSHKIFRDVILSLFPIKNAAHVAAEAVWFALEYLAKNRVQALAKELRENPGINMLDLEPPFSTTLEALYMLGLKKSSFTRIYRYTKNGVDTPELQLPPSTLATCALNYNYQAIEFDKLFIGRGIYFISYEEDALPSTEIFHSMVRSFPDEKQIRPLVINSNEQLYVYGKTSAETWELTPLGQSVDYMIRFCGPCYTKVRIIDDYEVDRRLIDRIVALEAHLPFAEPERIEFKVGSSRYAFFGMGPRACPAASIVGRLSKELLVAAVREFKDYKSDFSHRSQNVAIPYILPAPHREENFVESDMIGKRITGL